MGNPGGSKLLRLGQPQDLGPLRADLDGGPLAVRRATSVRTVPLFGAASLAPRKLSGVRLESMATDSLTRQHHVRRGITLEYLTIGWNVLECLVAIVAGITAGSVALLGFGVDSAIESASGSLLL